MKRLGIFVFYDIDGIVDRYIEFLLKDLCPNLSRLVIVSNGKILEEGKRKLVAFSSDIIERENSGFDGAAYKEILIDYIPQKEVLEYDEIVLFNDTFYGPFYSFEKIFNNMADRRCDIWGLSKHEAVMAMGKVRNAHVQSFFINIKKNVVKSKEFWDFWLELGTPTNFENAVDEFEVYFSKKMSEAGFNIDVYTDVEKYVSEDLTRNYNYSQLDCGDLICNYNYPILKRKNLIVCNRSNRNSQKAMKYIQEEYDYDVSMIWENALRRFDLNDLRWGVGLDFVLPKYKSGKEKGKISAALVVFVNSKQYLIDCLKYLNVISEKLDVYLAINDTVDIKRESPTIDDNITVIEKNNLGYASFLKSIKNLWVDKEFIISIYNEATNRIPLYQEIFLDNIWENIAGNNEIILEIDNLFKKNAKMGVVYPSVMPEDRRTWVTSSQMKMIKEVANKKQWKINLEKEKGIFQARKSFWMRTNILSELLGVFDFSEEIWTILMPYLVQQKGYYPAYVSNADYSARLIGCYESVLRKETIRRIDLEAAVGGNLTSVPSEVVQSEVVPSEIAPLAVVPPEAAPAAFYKLLSYAYGGYSLYIYGCGLVATRCMKLCGMANIDIKGFIISDAEEKIETFMGRPVIWLSEFKEGEKTVIIIGVGKKLKGEIYKNLEERNIENVIEIV